MATLKWRSDIDVLRAISVIAVILYHYQLLPLMSGGFVGVDVFFVISGYLITAIIVREVSEGRFSFLDFYDRRVRRILPAALATVFFTLLAGYFILLPSSYAQALCNVRSHPTRPPKDNARSKDTLEPNAQRPPYTHRRPSASTDVPPSKIPSAARQSDSTAEADRFAGGC